MCYVKVHYMRVRAEEIHEELTNILATLKDDFEPEESEAAIFVLKRLHQEIKAAYRSKLITEESALGDEERLLLSKL